MRARPLPLVVAALALASLLAFPPPAGADETAPDLRILGPTSALPAKVEVAVPFAITNKGPGPVTNLVAAFRTETGIDAFAGLGLSGIGGDGLRLVGTDGTRRVGTLRANASETVTLLVATPERAGAARLLVTLTFQDATGLARTSVEEIGLKIGPPPVDPLLIVHDQKTLTAGERGTLAFRIANPSAIPIEALEVALEIPLFSAPAGDAIGGAEAFLAFTPTPAIAPLGAARLLVGVVLPPGAEIRVTAPVAVSQISPDLAPFALSARYAHAGAERVARFDFAARVQGSVAFRLIDVRLEAGEDARYLSGTLVNTGTGTAWTPVLSTAPGSPLRALRPSIIEDLEPNEAVTFRLPVTLLSPLADGASVPLLVEWNDEYGKVYETEVEARITEVESREPAPWWRRVGPGDAPVPAPGIGSALAAALLASALTRAARTSRRRSREKGR